MIVDHLAEIDKGWNSVSPFVSDPRHGGEIGVCGTCMDARGISEAELAEGTRRSTLEELTGWTQWAGKVLVF